MGRYDEGTAFMPIVTHKNKLPLPVRERYRFLAPDADTQDLPPDWYSNFRISTAHTSNSTCRYMRICGMAVEILRGDRRLLETFPHKELQDYWGSRPRYMDGTIGGYSGPAPTDSTPGASGSGSANILVPEESPNELPPPPYTLEAGDDSDKPPSPAHEGFETAPTSPSDQQNYNVSDLANDLGRQSLGGPSNSPPHPHIPGGFGPDPTSSPQPNPFGQPTGPPAPAFTNRPTVSPQSTLPPTTSQTGSSYFPQPVGGPQDVGMPFIPIPEVTSNPHRQSVNFNTPFHWSGDYPNPQSQPPGGYNTGAPTNPWDPPVATSPQETTPYSSGYQPSYSNPPPPAQHNRPPVHPVTKTSLPPQSPHDGPGAMNSSPPYLPPQSTYPGQVGPGSYFGYDQKTDEKGKDGWGGPPPQNSSYPGPPTSGQVSPPYPGSGYPQQSSYPGQTYGGPPSNSPPLSQGYGQYQSSYPGMANTPVPGQPDRPPTRPPTSNSSPTSQGYGQQQSSYQGMSNPATPGPDRPPTSHSSRPTQPHHQSSLPPQTPPLPGGYNYSPGPPQSTYGGINPSASPPPSLPYQPTGPSPYGYQQHPQQQQSTYPGYNPSPGTSPYPGYPGTHPPLPPRECNFHSCAL